MTFRWPQILYLVILLPGVVGLYVWILHRRSRDSVRYSSAILLREAGPPRSRLRRHLPFGLLMAALAALIMAASGPQAIINVPVRRATLILAIDVSRSMCARDMLPTRLQAAEAAAASFIGDQPPGTEIGVVAYAGFAELVQAPTTDREAVQRAIASLLTGGPEAIGSGILESVDAIAQADPTVAPVRYQVAPVPNGEHAPDVIVLLADGVNNAGPSPLQAAQTAADRGVRIYTIGFGTQAAGPVSCQSSDPSEFGGSGNLRPPADSHDFPRGIDEATLKRISAMTGGAYYAASSAEELEGVLLHLPAHMSYRQADFDWSFLFAGLGALLTSLGIVLSLIWHPRP